MDPCSPTSSWREMNFQLRCTRDLYCYFLVIARVPIGVHAILISLERKVAVRQEREIDFEITRVPISHRAYVPVAAISPGKENILCDSSVEHPRIVPYSWNRG